MKGRNPPHFSGTSWEGIFPPPAFCSHFPSTHIRSDSRVGFSDASVVKNPPVVQERQERWVRSLGGEVLLEKEMATHSSILAWEIPGSEEPGGLQSVGTQRVRHNWNN